MINLKVFPVWHHLSSQQPPNLKIRCFLYLRDRCDDSLLRSSTTDQFKVEDAVNLLLLTNLFRSSNEVYWRKISTSFSTFSSTIDVTTSPTRLLSSLTDSAQEYLKALICYLTWFCFSMKRSLLLVISLKTGRITSVSEPNWSILSAMYYLICVSQHRRAVTGHWYAEHPFVEH